MVDRFASYLVVQVTALAMAVRLETILPSSWSCCSRRASCCGPSATWSKAEGLDLARRAVSGASCREEPLVILDGGLRYQVDLTGGQKTGFYLDQRENRRAAAAYFRDRRVLDMFCYSGGFALSARPPAAPAKCWASMPAAAPWPWPRPTPGSTA